MMRRQTILAAWVIAAVCLTLAYFVSDASQTARTKAGLREQPVLGRQAVSDKTPVADIANAQAMLPFRVRAPLAGAGRLAQILVDAHLSTPEGKRVESRPASARALYLVYDSGIQVFEKGEPGFKSDEEFADFTMGETYADTYMRRFKLGDVTAVKWDAGTYRKKDASGNVIYEASIPSTIVTWWKDGVGYSVSSRTEPAEALLPIARQLVE